MRLNEAGVLLSYMSNQKAVPAEFKINPSRLVSVRREEFPKGYRFIGVFDDGRELVLRAKATRPYIWAAVHLKSTNTKFWHFVSGGTDPGCGSYDMSDVRGFVTFHSKSQSQADGCIVRQLFVQS